MTAIWAHRGASGQAPENTLAAFDLAVQQGADGVELDVQFSADGVVVVMHDETVDRTTNGTGFVKDLGITELQGLDAGRGEVVPSLSQVLDLLRDTELKINIELKNSIEPYPALEKAVFALIDDPVWRHRIVISSFNHLSVHSVAQAGVWPVGLLYVEPLYDPAAYAKHVGATAVHPAFGSLLLDRDAVQQLHASDIKINTWTVDEEAELGEALAIGVNAVITNYPDRALALRG